MIIKFVQIYNRTIKETIFWIIQHSIVEDSDIKMKRLTIAHFQEEYLASI